MCKQLLKEDEEIGISKDMMLKQDFFSVNYSKEWLVLGTYLTEI